MSILLLDHYIPHPASFTCRNFIEGVRKFDEKFSNALDFHGGGDEAVSVLAPSTDQLDAFSAVLWFEADNTGQNGLGRLFSKDESFQINLSNYSYRIYFTAQRWDGLEGQWRGSGEV